MTGYSIISTSKPDIILEYGSLKIPIKKLSCTRHITTEFGPGYRYTRAYHSCDRFSIDVETYPVSGHSMKTVLENINKAKLTVYAEDKNMVREPIMTFYSFVPINPASFSILHDEMTSFEVSLEAGNQIPR